MRQTRAFSHSLILTVEDLLPQGIIEYVDPLQELVSGLLLPVKLRVLVAESIEIVAELVNQLLVVRVTTNELNETPLGLAEQGENATSLLNQIVENLQGVPVVIIEEGLPIVDALLVSDFVPLLVLLCLLGRLVGRAIHAALVHAAVLGLFFGNERFLVLLGEETRCVVQDLRRLLGFWAFFNSRALAPVALVVFGGLLGRGRLTDRLVSDNLLLFQRFQI